MTLCTYTCISEKVGVGGGGSFILTQQCPRVNWAAASFARLSQSDRLIMKHCEMVVCLVVLDRLFSSKQRKSETEKGRDHNGTNRHHHATNYLSVLV